MARTAAVEGVCVGAEGATTTVLSGPHVAALLMMRRRSICANATASPTSAIPPSSVILPLPLTDSTFWTFNSTTRYWAFSYGVAYRVRYFTEYCVDGVMTYATRCSFCWTVAWTRWRPGRHTAKHQGRRTTNCCTVLTVHFGRTH